MRVVLLGGKTAPRLLQDLYLYDPQKQITAGYNILINLPYHDNEQTHLPLPPLPAGRGSCRHQWSIKSNQSKLPESEHALERSSFWTAGAYCSICRSHLEVLLDFGEELNFRTPCPYLADNRPLHHFVHEPDLSQTRQQAVNPLQSSGGFSWTETQCFKCSAWQCPTRLSIRFKPPRLIQDWVDQLTDPILIKTRAENAIAKAPERFEGIGVPLPVTVLKYLRSYLVDALSNPKGRIPGNNKKWLLSLGEPCADLLEYLGFMREGDDWEPPKAEPNAQIPYTNPVNICLDDILKELTVLISKRPDDERRSIKFQYIPETAANQLKSVLGCADYMKSIRSRTVDLTTEEHPFYAGLGAVEDFHDDLIFFAYRRQIDCDPENAYYYLECLQGIAEGRSSESLQTQVAIEASDGKISWRDVRAAFRDLGFEYEKSYDDDTIIGTFNSRVADAPKQEPDMRRALKIIGQIRSSEKIQYVASQAVTNYEQALLFLGATSDTSDDFITTMYTLKINERPSDESIARDAVALISDHRKSKALRNFLDTGVLGEVEMDVGQAYVRLGISDRTIDDDTILATYNLLVTDTPAQMDDLKRALTAIAKSKSSWRIHDFLNSGFISSEHTASEWPVGLANIGNTCYLNSLLQFYFTIKPLRDLVLNIDRFKMPTDEESLNSKRVGSRNISKKEVDRAQQFIDELQKLFRNMIASSKPSVTPEPELARLTLVSSSKEEHIRRQSMLSPTRPSLGEINGEPIIGPMLPPSPPPPLPQVNQKDTEMSEDLENQFTIAPPNDDHDGDSSSDMTLVDGPIAQENGDIMAVDEEDRLIQHTIFEDKENLPPSGMVQAQESDNTLIPLRESSPSRINEQQQLSPVDENEVESIDLTGDEPETSRTVENKLEMKGTLDAKMQTKKPPPFPPRPKPLESNAVQEAEYGAQQDVTEVIANVLFQLQCAIKAETIDDSGEQVDQVKALFFGKQKSYTTNRQGVVRTKEEYMSDIKVDVASGSRDIYSALDSAYDVQDVEVGGDVEPQYTSISQLPPVLQVLVQRVQFDTEKKTVFKSNNHLEMKETIYMDRYMDSSNLELMQRRQECWAWKKQVLRMEKRRTQLTSTQTGMDIPEVLETTHHYLRRIAHMNDEDPIDVPSMLLQGLQEAAHAAKEELVSLEREIKDLNTSISSQFSDLRTIPYRLQSVFIHRGYHNSGHYWIYIYDFTKQLWRKYNDEYVTEIKDTREIFEQEAGDRPATPYFLVYVKDQSRAELVDPICRDIVVPPAEESHDIIMQDYGENSAVQTPSGAYELSNAGTYYEPSKVYHPNWKIGDGFGKSERRSWDNESNPTSGIVW